MFQGSVRLVGRFPTIFAISAYHN